MSKFRRFRQVNKNNGQFHYWGFYNGEDVLPKLSANYICLSDSDLNTGLKDKNGKEIYEGDIVQTCFDEVGLIGFKRQAFTLIIQAYEDDTEYLINWISDNLEIIGNIHENPELLEDAS